MAKKKTHEEFIRELNKVHGEDIYIPLEDYKGANTKIKVKHNQCGHEWNVAPSSLLRGIGCPKCGSRKSNKKRTKTHEEFVKEIYNLYGNEYEILGEYINTRSKVLVRHNCKECSFHEWEIAPNNLLIGQGCPKCKGGKIRKYLVKTTERFKKEIKDKYGNEYTVLGEYKGAKTKILMKHNCKECNYHEWEITPSSLLQGKGCPVCSGNITKLGINTIWDTDRWMVDLGVSKEDAKMYSHSSGKKIIVMCPDCGRKKKIVIGSIYTYKTISCSCGDGKSYPEKFIVNMLEQLSLEFDTEYSPEWIKPKRYDFHIKDNNCIIETHGMQHYDDRQTSFRTTLKDQQTNDKYKKETSFKNGIKHYIELDCRESNLEWIKNSILNSELNVLFDLSKIDWLQCADFANKNIVKEVCDHWNNKGEDETTNDVGKKFNLDRKTIINYLKRGTKLGWCEYNPKDERFKGALKTIQKNKTKCKGVEILKNNQRLGMFESRKELEIQSEKMFNVKLLANNIASVCNGKRKQYKGFTFKYIEEDNNLNISKIA
ncbi:hypothetical protein JJB71_13265 [Clostridium perfringens]|uniref:hypothetical protein n=1 Tax=Clostridium perfringens TaxID=1502 RepID=UPI001ABB3096|nr:hypothetical protein [Clostridium perfringens]MBO3398508.1 hypothetical protein [Clostridium perfringens]